MDMDDRATEFRAEAREAPPPRSDSAGSDHAGKQASTPKNDLALVRAAIQGDDDALTQLAVRLDCIPRLVEARLSRYGRPQAVDVADLSQEVFTRIWSRIERFRGDGSLEGWIWGFVTHVIYSALKKATRPGLPTVSCDLDQLTAADEEDPSDAVAQALLALERLSESDEEIVTLRAIERRNYPEIAAKLACTERAAKGRYQRAMTRLREALQPKSKVNP